ncbi:tRNA pseudouridine(38-40) synthase TruA [Alkalibacter saccharofermentans]|uniref:tRNA pseudouridine synthase A n=1 Tax=Alkalibacter saccharofermentans DSM 14828 TaxID=1120975 RepID=A0A1M4WLM2_9FIRM|nr:tRNA pseudouridine(38-40) synthase TruA [Alkalibacter saccharofermentans]SHE82095.1 tRNA pseudouridine38-40 synthase [Alkalibacter saccharofermentans DSM 14828]
MKRNVKIVLEYDGGRYKGWQRLDSNDTIQGKLEDIVLKMTGNKTGIIGSGRTDSGVHARGQVANFIIDTDMKENEIKDYFNAYLPQDIAVKEVAFEKENFHSRHDAKEKTYVYYIYNNQVNSVFDRKFSLHVPEALDIEAIRKALPLFEGTHDFLGFSSLRKSKKITVRTINSLTMEKDGPRIKFVFKGDGFLYNTIRIIMGTILEIGTKKRKVSSIEEVFKTKTREKAGYTVPPHGLFLEEVKY